MGDDMPVEMAAGRNDAVGLALITLAREVWVMKDRQIVTEALLQEQGLLSALDAYQPGADLAARLTRERERFLGSIITVLTTGKPNEN